MKLYSFSVFRGYETWNLQKNEGSIWGQLFESGESVWMGGRISKRTVRVATETVKQQIKQWISDYRHVTIDETAVKFNMNHWSADNIVHDLGCRKVCSRWVPRHLSNDKCVWQMICPEHLDQHAHEGDAFLYRTMTGDKSWVYHYEPDSKRQSMQWKHPPSLTNKHSWHRLPLGKSYWHLLGCQCPKLVHFQENGQTFLTGCYFLNWVLLS
jgi:hypothetical protein